MKSKLYKNVIPEIVEQTGRNIVAWSNNKRGNGSRNLHVAELKPGVARAKTFMSQNGIIRHGFTSHWSGQCSAARIISAIKLAKGGGR